MSCFCSHNNCSIDPLSWRIIEESENFLRSEKKKEDEIKLSVQARESELYRCFAENKAGNHFQELKFIVSGK